MQVKEQELNEQTLTADVQSHSLAMTVAVISWSMLFATLLLGYFIYRNSQTTWPPLGVQSVPLALPNLSLFFVLMSSLTYFFAIKKHRINQIAQMKQLLCLSLVLGLAYMFAQIQFWKVLDSMNLFSSSNIFGSILHGFTWIHAGHMLIAILSLAIVLLICWNEQRAKKSFMLINNVGIFWHFLTIVWLVLYLTLFII